MQFSSRKEKQPLSKNKKKICVFTKFSDNGPSSKYRIMIFEEDLKRDLDVVEYRFWNEKYYSKYASNKRKHVLAIGCQYIINVIKRMYQIQFIAPKCDVVFFQKCVIPYMKKYTFEKLHNSGCKVVFDVDDAVFIEDKDGTVNIAKHSDVVIVGNEMLGDFYKKHNCNVVVIPTVDYTPDYIAYNKDTFHNKILLWLGSAATVDNLDLIIEPINKLIDKHPEVKFKYICDADHGYTALIKNSEFVKWKKDTVIRDMSDATIGIMPLKDNEYNKGKCGFKLIQYMNLGKPVVASDVGVNKKVVNRGGCIAENPDDFMTLVEKLLYDEKLYRECEAYTKKEFLEEYGYSMALRKLTTVFREI